MPLSKQQQNEIFQRADRLFQEGRFDQAVVLCRQVLQQNRRHPQVHRLLGLSLSALGLQDEARKHYREGIRYQPNDPDLYADLAATHAAQGEYEKAISLFEHALRIRHNHAIALRGLAEALSLIGRAEEGAERLERHVRGEQVDASIAMGFARCASRAGRIDEAIEALQKGRGDRDLPKFLRVSLLFRLARTLDRAGRYEEAFEIVQEANAGKAARFDPAAHTQVIDRMIRAWTSERIASFRNDGVPDERPVFIVGVPRSGTTLVEQILASHPQVHAAGELTHIPKIAESLGPAVVGANGIPFVASLDSIISSRVHEAAMRFSHFLDQLDHESSRITDKLPGNAMHLGLIALLFPKARVIHCVRDPLDTAISCYFNDFVGPNPWSYALRHIGCYIREHNRLMDHWKGVLPIPILDMSYEAIVEDLEPNVRRLLEFLGLPWNDRCLNFHQTKRRVITASSEQVIKPLYSSAVGRHRNYGQHLAELREALGSERRGPATG